MQVQFARQFRSSSQEGYTKIATSSEAIANRLDGKRCTRDHPHEQVLGGSKITSAAGHYTKELSHEIIKGIEEEFEKQYGAR